jgi:hypothetical protein
MPSVRHCRHCFGDCPGDCLLPGDQGLCIHNPRVRRSARERLLVLRTRRFWHRVLFGH